MPRTAAARKRPIAARPAVDIRVLLATAGEPDSNGAALVAAALANRYAAPVLALGVAPPFPHGFPALFSARQPTAIDERSRRSLRELVQRSTRSIPGAERWEKRVVLGEPAITVNAVAKSWNATLIVIGMGRHRRVDRIFGTETAVHVMKHARVPVLAVPSRMRALPEKVLAAIDFTRASVDAAQLAAEIMRPGGTLVLAHADGFAGVKARPGDLVDLYRAGARAKLDAAVREVRRKARRGVDAIVLEGHAGEELVSYARKEHCDLITLGGHAMGLVDRIVLGSVRTRVVRNAPCAVLIAPPRTGQE